MEKQDVTTILASVVAEATPWHSSSGYFCDRCGTECGSDLLNMCACCQEAVGAATGQVER